MKGNVKKKSFPANWKPQNVSAFSPSAAVQVPRGVVARAYSGREVARWLDAKAINFPILLSLIVRRVLQNGPERSRARRFGAAQRILDGEDRLERVYDEGKEGSIRFLKRNKRNG